MKGSRRNFAHDCAAGLRVVRRAIEAGDPAPSNEALADAVRPDLLARNSLGSMIIRALIADCLITVERRGARRRRFQDPETGKRSGWNELSNGWSDGQIAQVRELFNADMADDAIAVALDGPPRSAEAVKRKRLQLGLERVERPVQPARTPKRRDKPPKKATARIPNTRTQRASDSNAGVSNRGTADSNAVQGTTFVNGFAIKPHPVDVALSWLHGRVGRDAGGCYRLDGRRAGPRELVAAANDLGAGISYPGINPTLRHSTHIAKAG